MDAVSARLWSFLFLDHPRSTPRPQGYWSHLAVAASGSVTLIWIGLVGLVHAAVPVVAPFYTSTRVIRLFRALYFSGRHEPEVRRELGRLVP